MTVQAESLVTLRPEQLDPRSPLGRRYQMWKNPDDDRPSRAEVIELETEATRLEALLKTATIDTMSVEDFMLQRARLDLLRQTITKYDALAKRRAEDDNYRASEFREEYGTYIRLMASLKSGELSNQSKEWESRYKQALAMITPTSQ
jgi:hypothetical protein